jgi:NAD(P)-dependent dehydrogenase (short-subunit alcohol dehydrogenase family)
MLKGKLALVTGAASGIGFQIAKLFANEGANLCLVDIQKDLPKVLSQINHQEAQHSTHFCDVSNSSEVNNLFASIKEQYPSHKVPTIVVNSAGITRDNTLFRLTEQDWNKVIDVNLKGTFLITQNAAKELVANYPKDQKLISYASIINIASIVGKQGNWGQTNYSASKAGVEGLTVNILFYKY